MNKNGKELEFIKSMRLVMHQLRGPLTVIKGNLSLLKDEAARKSESDLKECLEEISRANEKMLNLVNALSNVFKLESGGLVVNPQPINLSQLADEIISRFASQIQGKKLNLEKAYAADLATINLDPDLAGLIIQNLLSNAVNYTPEGGKVKFKIEKQEDGILMEVSDTGVGIPEEQQSKVFTKFFRADNIIEESDGAGLGLYIVKSLVQLFGGKIWFESKQNKGTVFSVLIPLKTPKGTV